MASPRKGNQIGPKRAAGSIAGKARTKPGTSGSSNTMGNPNSRVASDKRGETTKRRMKANKAIQNREVKANRATGAARTAAKRAAMGMAGRALGPVGLAIGAVQAVKAIDRAQRGEPKASGSPGQMGRKKRK